MTNAERNKRITKARAQYAAITKHLRKKAAQINKLVRDCPHDKYWRQADPSGGHDHAYTCKTCGHEW